MTGHKNDFIEPRIESLKTEYQAIKAPSHLAKRIAAHAIDDRRQEPRFAVWTASLAAVLILAAIVPILYVQDTGTTMAKPKMPSMSMIRGKVPTRPLTGVPTLSDIRNLPKVRPPSPKPKPTEPQGLHRQPDADAMNAELKRREETNDDISA